MKIENVSIGYGRTRIASGVSFSLGKGRLACLIGSNGCGKSTLIRTLAMLQKPLSGKISHDGRDLSAMDPGALSRTVAVVLTGRPGTQNLTVGELVAAGRMPYTGFFGTLRKEDREQVFRAMETAGIVPLAGRKLSTLSDGEYQKAVIARALAQQTPVILLDEPTAFLDYAGKVDLTATVRNLCREAGKTVLMSTHDVNLAVRMADDIFLMDGGKVARSSGEDGVRRFVGERAAAFL